MFSNIIVWYNIDDIQIYPIEVEFMKLSNIFSDGMVLQQNKKITISGKSNYPQQVVVVNFLGKTYETISDNNGDWSINLGQLEAGGPYQMEIIAEERLLIKDILVGEVWVLAGQSNMELPINRTLDLFREEMEAVNQPFIRHFAVPQSYNFHEPKKMLEGGTWKQASQQDVLDFSAVGYFFAKELYQKYGVPIGLIQTAVGGTPIEAWLSEKTLRELGGYETTLDQCKIDSSISEIKLSDEKREKDWFTQLNEQDQGLKHAFYTDSFPVADWKDFEVPNSWEDTELENLRGSVWFKKEFDLPSSILEGEAKLMLGTIIDADDTYINGIHIGSTGYRYPPRRYPVPKGLLRSGKNTITVRIISTQTTGGFVKDMPYKLVANGQELDLQGGWKYHIGAITETLEAPTFFQYKPAGVFNEMIAPIGNYSIKGVLWYQGESNTGNPKGYSILFNRLVKDWRENWKLGEIPFIYTQLANLDTGDPDNINWAELREEQRIGLDNPNTAMAVTIDIGEHNDLHPQNKQTLGHRLALCANHLAYHEDVEYSGPLYKDFEQIGNTIKVSFHHIGSGLTVHGDKLKTFTICGDDRKFVPATATISDNTVIVSHEDIKEPRHVRYAYSDNPEEANLYNTEGLPASPFSTE